MPKNLKHVVKYDDNGENDAIFNGIQLLHINTIDTLRLLEWGESVRVAVVPNEDTIDYWVLETLEHLGELESYYRLEEPWVNVLDISVYNMVRLAKPSKS